MILKPSCLLADFVEIGCNSIIKYQVQVAHA